MDKKTSKKIAPVLYSVPVAQKMDVPARAEILPKIESGELEFIDFRARVFGTGEISNPVAFRDEDLAAFALSFAGAPFLRDHGQYAITDREGVILASKMDNGEFVQDIRLTTRRGMTDYVEGRIDRFSIGWSANDLRCSICGRDYLGGECNHFAGRKYEGQLARVVFIEPVGLETSAVNVPAVAGTYIEAQLQKLGKLNPADELGQESDSDADNQKAILALARARTNYHEIAVRALRTGELNMNYREKISARTDKLNRAKELTELADAETRDFSEAETAEFNALMADVDALTAQIEIQSGQREKLRAELAREFSAPDAEKPEPITDPKLMKRGNFEALSAIDRTAFLKAGGKIQD